MSLNGRVTKLEARLTASGTGPDDDAEVELWASLWTAAGLEESRAKVAALEFLIHCQSTGVTPTISAMNKWALQGEAAG